MESNKGDGGGEGKEKEEESCLLWRKVGGDTRLKQLLMGDGG